MLRGLALALLLSALAVSPALAADPTPEPSPSAEPSPSEKRPVSMPWPPPGAIRDLPECGLADTMTAQTSLDEWATTLLDTRFRLPSAYQPPLTTLAEAGWRSGEGGAIRVRDLPELLTDLRSLRGAARKKGLALVVISGYRSYGAQKRLFATATTTAGKAAALRTTARAGHSEHQLGTAFDFSSGGGREPWRYADWGRTPEGKWMAANAWKYGFIMSYPAESSAVSCYGYEPWHFRYYGRELAREIRASGGVARETLWYRYGGGLGDR